MFNMMSSFRGPASSRIREPIITTVRRLGLSSSLQLALDAGDSASYSSGQTWSDVSGNGNHFYRGLTSGAEATDPTFNGTAGQNTISNYFSFDGGDFFYLVAGETLPTWANDFHKNNGVGTVLCMAYINTSTSFQSLMGTYGATNIGWECSINGDNTIYFATWNSGLQIATTSTITMSEDAWHLLGYAFDEANNSHYNRIDGTTEANTDTAPSPAAANTSGGFTLGSVGYDGSPQQLIESGGRMNFVLIWNRKLSTTETDNVYRHIRYKYGI